ncbi:uncharacterized protein ARMOST_06326 [Armillaria ostoyae]|uniref:Uncharacterized protein n=1 Tax=Armillaria ostoyae TaxID=47428 RepID=A0A284R2Q7_ARMOS|nr:uncharacterized protein ARMOST_06326 [Armillaria ostoyae]
MSSPQMESICGPSAIILSIYASRFLILHSNHHCTRSLLTTRYCDILHEEEAIGRSKITTSSATKLRL